MADIILEFADKCMLVRISISTEYDKTTYDATRRCWRANKNKAQEADYVLAVVNNIVKGVFKPKNWYVTVAKKCEKEKERCKKMKANTKLCKLKKRIRFDGVEASADVKRRYLDKEIPSKYQKSQNPVRYTF
jgi:uncharacterized protein